jgi:hypothetical protein
MAPAHYVSRANIARELIRFLVKISHNTEKNIIIVNGS